MTPTPVEPKSLAALRRRLAETERRIAAADARYARATRALNLLDARGAVIDAAERSGYVYPEDMPLLIGDALTFDDAGKPTNIPEAVEAYRATRPEQAGARRVGTKPRSAGSDTPPGRPTAPPGASSGAGPKESHPSRTIAPRACQGPSWPREATRWTTPR